MVTTPDSSGGPGRDALVDALRRFQPAKVQAVDAAGEAKPVAVPGGRKRWSRVADVLEGLEWVKVELLDKSGGLLTTIVGEDMPPAGAAGKADVEMDRIVRAQDIALARHDKFMERVLQSHEKLEEMLMGRLSAFEASYGNMMKLCQAAMETLVQQQQSPMDSMALDVMKKAGLLPEPGAVNGEGGKTS